MQIIINNLVVVDLKNLQTIGIANPAIELDKSGPMGRQSRLSPHTISLSETRFSQNNQLSTTCTGLFNDLYH